MGVFSNRSAFGESYNAVDLLDESIDTTGVLDIEEGAISQLIAESEMNWSMMMKTVGVCELAAIEQDGEAIYEASDISGFFGKIKEFFKNILEKIKKIFKNFLVKFDAWTKSGKDFVDKYKKQLISAKTKDLHFQGYKFTNLDYAVTEDDMNKTVNNAGDDYIDMDPEVIANKFLGEVKDPKEAMKELDKLAEDYDDTLEKMRADTIAEISKSKQGSLTAEEFSVELFKAFRDDEETKTELEDSYINVTSLMADMVNYNRVKKDTDKMYSEIDKFLRRTINKLDKAENILLKKAPGEKDETTGKREKDERISAAIRAIAHTNRVHKDMQNLATQVSNAHLRALKDNAQQAKAICAKLLTRKATNEAAFDDGDFGVTHSVADAFANVNFI